MRNSGSSVTALGCIALIAVTIIGTVENGWAMATLWSWFAVPVFNAPVLGIAQAVGLAALIRVMSGSVQYDPKVKQYTNEEVVSACIFTILSPLLGVGLGWIVLQFV